MVKNMDPTCLAMAMGDPDTHAETVVISNCPRNVVSDAAFVRALQMDNIDGLFVPHDWIPPLSDALDRNGMYRKIERIDLARQISVIRPLPHTKTTVFPGL